jgi:hypothetical protein
VRKLRPGQARREVPDAHTPGLYLVIQPSGKKSWAARTRVHGKLVKITLKALDLVKAGTEAAGLIEAAREGRDPRTLAADAEAARAVTFAELADQYLERWAKPRNRTPWTGSIAKGMSRIWRKSVTATCSAARWGPGSGLVMAFPPVL